jgi:3',5'-nucleoside bisphosphate phosphatase
VKFADLHVHTYYSDSTFSPEEVMACANQNALAAIGICDHDSIDGIGPCQDIGSGLDIEVVPGIEMSAEESEAEIHMLGYFIDWQDKGFRNKLKDIQASRIERVHAMLDKLRGHGIDIKPEDVFGLAGKGTVSRLHVAQAMIRTGSVKSFRQVFRDYIGYNGPCYVPYTKLTPKDAISLIRSVGGVPVIAHPNVIDRDELIPAFVSYGLMGIEAFHTDHNSKVRKRYEEMAEQYGLIVTGGSDCHGMGKGKVLMGGVKVPFEVVDKLREASAKVRKG